MMFAGFTPSSNVSATSTFESSTAPVSRGIVGHDDLGHQDAARRRHEGGREQVRQVLGPEQACVSREDRAGDARHPDAHHGEQARRRKRGEIGPDDQRRFRLADENVGCGRQGFDPADPRDPADRAADPAHDPLHDPEIIEDRDQAREEDDHRERRDCKAVGEGVRFARPEQEFGALGRISEEIADSPDSAWIAGAAPARVEHQPGDERLQRERRADDSQSDRAAVRRQQEGDAEDDDDPGDAEQLATHESPSPEARKISTRPCPA